MKTIPILSTAALLGCATAAHNAYIWTIDAGIANHEITQSSSVSPEAASAIIARRRGLDGGLLLDIADKATLSDINQFGGHQASLFDSTTDKAPEKILIRMNGYNGGISQFPVPPTMWAQDATTNLINDFKAKTPEQSCAYTIPLSKKDHDGAQLFYSYSSNGDCMSTQDARRSHTIASVLKYIPAAKEVSHDMAKLLQQLHHLSTTSNVQSTVLVLPHDSQLKKAKAIRRDSDYEEPMEFGSALSSLTDKFPAIVTSSNKTNTSHPLPSVIPLCFTSMDVCTNTTNSCSGHGSCYKAHAGCFKCRCGSTIVRQNKDGSKKTVQWGGNACEKKDVSVPFVLFASIGLLLATLIAGGIGMIYGMGSEDLPSVLGAGVSGPRASK